ncbi:MAG TPA: hypothetical protein PK413_12505, partial [Thermoanaerobaculia bacterium]|nr:hypothetical protein [Thermoanaerobaculia bacterium]
PPRCLGVLGAFSWLDRAGGGRGDALDELAAEAYVFVFVDRLRSLRAQLLVKPNVEGLVLVALRQFLHERQRDHDPLGARVFEVLRDAVRLAVESGELNVLDGDERIRNDTVLSALTAPAPIAPADVWFDLASKWAGVLLPDMVTARGGDLQELIGRLTQLLRTLPSQGVRAFRFRDLAEALKAEVRARWGALWDQGQVGGAEADEQRPARLAILRDPVSAFEERQFLRAVLGCVQERLESLEAPERTRRYLRSLWGFLRVQVAGANPQGSLDRLAQSVRSPREEETEGLPSHRRLADLLGIPRERIPGLLSNLGSIYLACHALHSGRRPGSGLVSDLALPVSSK